MKTLSWLIRRELWENKAIWAMPLIVGALLLLAATFGDIDLGPAASLMPPDQPRVCGALVLFGFDVALFFVMTLYSIWYLLDCLYVDRKDRSVLFWRALPVSDTQAVLSKLATALIVIPLVSFAAADVTTLGMALAITLRGKGASDVLWQSQNWLQLQVLWVYLMATMAIWYLPIAGWLLAISAWARRSVLLWAVMPLLVPYLIERWLLRTHAIGQLIVGRLSGFVSHAFHNNADEAFSLATVIDKEDTPAVAAARTAWDLIDAAGFFLNPATWAGVAVGIVLIAVAIELRRRRADA